MKLRFKSGFTLIEMAVVIMILGIAIAAATPLYKQYLTDREREATEDVIRMASAELGNFRSLRGRYPCPASLTDVRGVDPTYGYEGDCAPPPLPAVPQAVGTCAGGICIEQSIPARLIDIDPDPAATNFIRPRVRVGWLPFRELNMDEKEVLDGHGNRLLYVVTERLAVDTTFQADHGGVEILNGQGVSVLGDNSGSAHFIVISPGPNSLGGWTRDGIQMPCPDAGSVEEQNSTCTIDLVNNSAIYQDAEGNIAGGNTNFDDSIIYFTQAQMPLWQMSVNDPLNIYQKTSGNVGVRIPTTFSFNVRTAVDGNILVDDDPVTPGVSEGIVFANQFCTEADASDCMQPETIAGTPETVGGVPPTGGLKCPAGTYMTGISNNAPECEPIASDVLIRCPPGEVMTGIDADGDIDCDPSPADCPPQDVGICDTIKTLPETSRGAIGLVTAGDSRVKGYYCQTNGSWSLPNPISATGECDCTPGVETLSGDLCGDGYVSGDGNPVTAERTITCAPYTATDWALTAGSCNCVGTVQTTTAECDNPDFQGQKTLENTLTCGTPDTWSGWVEVANTCTCVSGGYSDSLSCTNGLSGSIDRVFTFTCPAGTWSSVVTDNCWCDASKTETDMTSDECPPGEIGNTYYERSIICPGGGFGSWVKVSDDCKAPPPASCKWVPASTGESGQTTGIGPNVSTQPCDCGEAAKACHEKIGSESYINYGFCTCGS